MSNIYNYIYYYIDFVVLLYKEKYIYIAKKIIYVKVKYMFFLSIYSVQILIICANDANLFNCKKNASSVYILLHIHIYFTNLKRYKHAFFFVYYFK